MKIIQINASAETGSTGKIVCTLKKEIDKSGNKCAVLAAYGRSNNAFITEKLPERYAVRKNLLCSRLSGKMGYRNKLITQKAVDWIKKQKPDIIHLHNIHGDWINLKLLFEYIKKEKVPVVWTLHDCWPFTGRCSHFETNNCLQWKEKCIKCPNMKVYPISYFFDLCKEMHSHKKEWFTGIDNLVLVTPSKWLAEYTKQSFLKSYPIEVIHNGIDTSKYSPEIRKSRLVSKEDDKFIILGVANAWDIRKGLMDFYKLNEMLDKRKYQIVLVGLNKQQLSELPDGIIGISRTDNEQQLIDIYSSADVFVNPTYEDNYPTTNLEAISCGTPTITYNTGGSGESILEGCGYVVEQGDVTGLYDKILLLEEKGKITFENLCKARRLFDVGYSSKQYLQLYERIYNGKTFE